MAVPQPWNPAQATEAIRRLARMDGLRLSYTVHARERMFERDLIVGDVLHVLKNGFVQRSPEPSSQGGLFRYRMESRTPNSGRRSVAVVAIPDPERVAIKIVTVMWNDG